MNGPFEAGEKILLVDQRDRRYLLTLQTGETWHSHGGGLPHDLLIGSPEGTLVHSATGMAFRAFRPRLADFVLKMPRGAQLVYPKDVGAILVGADVFPGARVLEAGTGSGSLTLALCRATGPEGLVVSYDQRREFQEGAARNIESFFGKAPDWLELREGDVRDVGGSGETFDRAILDLPEPWESLGPAAGAIALAECDRRCERIRDLPKRQFVKTNEQCESRKSTQETTPVNAARTQEIQRNDLYVVLDKKHQEL